MRRTNRRWAVVGVSLALTLAACSTGTDAVSPGSTFSFVAPGGKTKIFYDPPSARGVSPDISGDDLLRPGTHIGLADYPGKVVVLNIWGSWCGPCRAEMPELQRVYDHTKNSGVTLLGIDVRDDTRSAPQDFIRNIGVTYPSIYDPPGRSLLTLEGYPRNIVPSTIVLDRHHRVAAVFLMALLAADLQPVVDRLAAEPPQPMPASSGSRGVTS
jgi:thiol-disulfide isomerase/thioredoxin